MTLNYHKIIKYISAPRLKRYEDVCNGDQKRTLKLYQANIKLSQAFYSVLSLLEVVLRNALNEELSNFFQDRDWIINQRTGFMIAPGLEGRYIRNEVDKSIR